MGKIIYLDNAATARVPPEAADYARSFMTDEYFNIGASYERAAAVGRSFAEARAFIAGTAGAGADELIFTSSATEANNLVLRGGIRRRGAPLVVTAGEHPSVYNTARALSGAYEVRIVPLNGDGTVNAERLVAAAADAALVSVIHVGNETGAVNDIELLCRAVKGVNGDCLFHSDGVQAFAKIPVNVRAAGVDFYTFSGHKAGGPKGAAGLYVKKGVNLNPLITGGGQERGLRSGTENVPAVMGLYRALRLKGDVGASLERARRRARFLRDALRDALRAAGVGAVFNGQADGKGSPYITGVSFLGLKAEVLSNILAERGVIVGLGSACSASARGNRVLEAMKLSRERVEGNVRLSFSDETTDDEIREAVEIIRAEAAALLKKTARAGSNG